MTDIMQQNNGKGMEELVAEFEEHVRHMSADYDLWHDFKAENVPGARTR